MEPLFITAVILGVCMLLCAVVAVVCVRVIKSYWEKAQGRWQAHQNRKNQPVEEFDGEAEDLMTIKGEA